MKAEMKLSAKVSMSEIAREAGVSKMTVSLALRNDPQVSDWTRVRIQRIAARMKYTGNPWVSELMAKLRNSRRAIFKATIGVINANGDPHAFRRHPTIPVYLQGITGAANKLGYGLDHFWLKDPKIKPDQLYRILRARNIRGVLLVGLMEENRLPEGYGLLWEKVACVATGVRTSHPTFSFACVDHHAAALLAFQKAIEHGYRRPALVLDDVIDRLIDRRFLGGALVFQMGLPVKDRIPPFMKVREADQNPFLFKQWFKRYQPDCLVSLYHRIEEWVQGIPRKVPEEVGLIQLEWREDHPEWSGVIQHNDQAGEAALNMLIHQIHQNQFGVPQNPTATLISGSWREGATLRPTV